MATYLNDNFQVDLEETFGKEFGKDRLKPYRARRLPCSGDSPRDGVGITSAECSVQTLNGRDPVPDAARGGWFARRVETQKLRAGQGAGPGVVAGPLRGERPWGCVQGMAAPGAAQGEAPGAAMPPTLAMVPVPLIPPNQVKNGFHTKTWGDGSKYAPLHA